MALEPQCFPVRGPLGEAPGRGQGRELPGFLGPPLQRGQAPSGTLRFGCVAQTRGVRGARTQPSVPEGAPLAPPLGAYLGFTGQVRLGRWSSGPASDARSPWAGSGASRPAGEASLPRAPCSALRAQRAGALSPPGQRERSRAAGWRGRTPGSAGCGTRRGSAAPAFGPRQWVAPWDAETPCCAAGRAGLGPGSGVPGGREGAGPGERAPRVGDGRVGERPRGRGRGSCLEGGADPGTQTRAPARAQSGAARLMEGERSGERSRTSDRHRQTRN